ncbi:unnamed protein product [Caenorhabditis sp. 36 PRJEB53466]|nr:unnamed protein product [Caenorhabditis sp. 36 PRJEB53466]
MPTCLKRCMPAMDSIGTVLTAFKQPEEIKKLCSNLTEATKCATAAGCNEVFVGAISNAFQFMCMDNLDKVSGQLACIQDSAGDLQQECEATCAVQADVIENARKNTVDTIFTLEKMCNSTSCLVDCYQDNIQKYCEIGEDNVIDTIFSQLEAMEEQQQPAIFAYMKKDEKKKTGLQKILGWMMPDGCDDEKLKIKLTKKPTLTDKPKNVGSPPEAAKEAPSQKTSPSETRNNSTDSDALLKAKPANVSSAR